MRGAEGAPQNCEPVTELRAEPDFLHCPVKLSLTLPLAGPLVPRKVVPPKCFQVFESSWNRRVGWLLRGNRFLKRQRNLLFTSPARKSDAHICGGSSITRRPQAAAENSRLRRAPQGSVFLQKTMFPLNVLFKREVNISTCHVKLRGFSGWQKAIAPALGHQLGHLCSRPRGCDKGVWPMPTKLRFP